MTKKKHSWKQLFGTGKLQHKECADCQLQKWFDTILQKVVYVDLWGKQSYWAGECKPIKK